MKSSSTARSYRQCFVCREWSWDACDAFRGTTLCLPCYVDVLEVRQARGAMGEPAGGPKNSKASEANITGRSPSPFRQLDLFGS